MTYDLIKALKPENVQFLVAPYEADPQLAYLTSLPREQGGVDAVLTEDSDLVMFGCSVVLFKCSAKKEGVADEMRIHETFSADPPTGKNMISFNGWNQEKLLAMGILAGCDFSPSLLGMGLKTAYALVEDELDLESTLVKLRTKQRWKEDPSEKMKSKRTSEAYENRARRARESFLYPLVYDPVNGRTLRLNTLPEDLALALERSTSSIGGGGIDAFGTDINNNTTDGDDISISTIADGAGNTESVVRSMEHIGPDMEAHIAHGIAHGYLNPHTLQPYDSEAPSLPLSYAWSVGEDRPPPPLSSPSVVPPVALSLTQKLMQKVTPRWMLGLGGGDSDSNSTTTSAAAVVVPGKVMNDAAVAVAEKAPKTKLNNNPPGMSEQARRDLFGLVAHVATGGGGGDGGISAANAVATGQEIEEGLVVTQMKADAGAEQHKKASVVKTQKKKETKKKKEVKIRPMVTAPLLLPPPPPLKKALVFKETQRPVATTIPIATTTHTAQQQQKKKAVVSLAGVAGASIEQKKAVVSSTGVAASSTEHKKAVVSSAAASTANKKAVVSLAGVAAAAAIAHSHPKPLPTTTTTKQGCFPQHHNTHVARQQPHQQPHQIIVQQKPVAVVPSITTGTFPSTTTKLPPPPATTTTKTTADLLPNSTTTACIIPEQRKEVVNFTHQQSPRLHHHSGGGGDVVIDLTVSPTKVAANNGNINKFSDANPNNYNDKIAAVTQSQRQTEQPSPAWKTKKSSAHLYSSVGVAVGGGTTTTVAAATTTVAAAGANRGSAPMSMRGKRTSSENENLQRPAKAKKMSRNEKAFSIAASQCARISTFFKPN